IVSFATLPPVVYVPLSGPVAVVLSYLHSPIVVLSRTNVIPRAALAQELPRTWNSSVTIVLVERRHHGTPFPTPVVTLIPTNDDEHSFSPLTSLPVPANVAVSIVPSTFAPSFLVTFPV